MYSAFQLAKKYFRYRLTASNGKGHGIHSPFVFDFIKFVKNGKTPENVISKAEEIRNELLHNNEIIEAEDFGAGSVTLKNKRRKISSVARSSLKPKKFGQLLWRIADHYQCKKVLELGTSLGVTTVYLGSSAARVTTMEGSSAIANVAQKNFSRAALHNIELVVGNFNEVLPRFLVTAGKLDLVFIDGNHRKLPTIKYFESLLSHTQNESILVFDDVHWSKEMEEAWEIIKVHPAVTLTIDLFFIGIVFLRREFLEKQHFVVRF